MSRGGGLRYHADNRIQRERAAEQKQFGIQRFLKDQNHAAVHGQADRRVENMRRQRDEAAERRDLFTDFQYVTGEQERERKKHLEDIQERLANELQARRAQAIREETDRQRICGDSEELRALRGRLTAAATNKMRAVQLLERQARESEDDNRQAAMLGQVEDKRLRELEVEHQLEQEKQNQRVRVTQINQDQIANKERQRQEDGQRDYQRDKADVDELVARICAEDRNEMEARRTKAENERQVIWQQRIDKQAQDDAIRRWEAEQDRHIEDFSRKKREQEEEVARVKEQQELERRRILYKMLDVQVAKRNEDDKHQRILDEHYQEERYEGQRLREEAESRKKLEDKVQLRQAWDQAAREKEEKMRLYGEEEQRIRAELMGKFAEDDRIEMMNDQKRRMKVQEHKREVEKQVQRRREAYDAEREREMQDVQRTNAREEERLFVIEQERRRMLAEAAPLRDFFPKGTYEHESDLELVGEPIPARPVSDGLSQSMGRPGSQRQPVRADASAARLRPASLGAGQLVGMSRPQPAWGTPSNSRPGSPGRGAPRSTLPARQQWRPPLLGGAGLSI